MVWWWWDKDRIRRMTGRFPPAGHVKIPGVNGRGWDLLMSYYSANKDEMNNS